MDLHGILFRIASDHDVPHEHWPSDGVSAKGQQPPSDPHVDPSDPSLHVTPTHVPAETIGSIVGLDVGDDVSSGSGSGCC